MGCGKGYEGLLKSSMLYFAVSRTYLKIAWSPHPNPLPQAGEGACVPSSPSGERVRVRGETPLLDFEMSSSL